jgi:hypothetical protein
MWWYQVSGFRLFNRINVLYSLYVFSAVCQDFLAIDKMKRGYLWRRRGIGQGWSSPECKTGVRVPVGALRSEGKFDPSLYGWSYSAGADAAVLHAELRQNSGLPIEALVLLDPAFDSYDLNGTYLDSAGYKQKLAGLGVRVLIVDTQSLWAGWSSSNIKYCPIQGKKHDNVDDDPILVDEVYTWVSTGQIECNR